MDQRMEIRSERNFESKVSTNNECVKTFSMDLTNTQLKESVEECINKYESTKPKLMELRNNILKLQEANQNVATKIEMLEYNRVGSFNLYSEMKSCCQLLLEKQDTLRKLVSSSEQNYGHVKSYILSSKYGLDQLKSAEDQRSILYDSTFQHIKDKVNQVISVHKDNFNGLQNLSNLINKKISQLEPIDYDPLREAEKNYQKIIEENSQLSDSIEKEKYKLSELEKSVSEEWSKSEELLNILKQNLLALEKESEEKEGKLKHNLELLQECVNQSDEMKNTGNTLSLEICQQYEQQSVKLNRMSELKNNLKELNDTLSSKNTDLYEIKMIESCVESLSNEITDLETEIDKLECQVKIDQSDFELKQKKLEELNKIISDLNERNTTLKQETNKLESDIKLINNSCEDLLCKNKHTRDQLEAVETKINDLSSKYQEETNLINDSINDLNIKYNLLEKEHDNMTQHCDGLKVIYNDLQNEINNISENISMEQFIISEMNERDKLMMLETISNYKNLENLQITLNKEIEIFTETNDRLSNERDALIQKHDNEIQEIKQNIEDEKNEQISEMKSKQKELKIANLQYKELESEKNEINKVNEQIDNIKDLFISSELKLRSYLTWYAKQRKLNELNNQSFMFAKPQDTKISKMNATKSSDVVSNSDPSDHLKIKENVSVKTGSIDKNKSKALLSSPVKSQSLSAGKTSQTLTPSSCNVNKIPSFLPPKVKEPAVSDKLFSTDSSTDDSLSIVDMYASKFDTRKINPKPLDTSTPNKPIDKISQVSTPSSSVFNKIPYFIPPKIMKSTVGDKLFSTDSSTDDSSSTLKLYGSNFIPGKINSKPLDTSTPKKEGDDSDQSFTQSLKQTNKVLLKSRLLNKKDRVKTSQLKQKNAKFNSSVIVIDSD